MQQFWPQIIKDRIRDTSLRNKLAQKQTATCTHGTQHDNQQQQEQWVIENRAGNTANPSEDTLILNT
jgi:hypothetical protein